MNRRNVHKNEQMVAITIDFIKACDSIKREAEIDKLQESREHCNEKNLESTKVGCTISNKRRDRNKQHEVENSNRLLFLRRIETGNNEVLKRILEDSKKNREK